MEYSLLKTIESPLGYFNPLQSMLQSPYQSTDFVNPGIGGLAKLFDVYVPIPYYTPPYCSNKTTDQQGFGSTLAGATAATTNIAATSSANPNPQENEQQIFGYGEPDKPTYMTKEKELGNNTTSPEVKVTDFEKQLRKINDNKRKLIGTEVFEAFMHPSVKTAKITFNNSKRKSSEPAAGSSAKATKTPNQKISQPSPNTKTTLSKHKFRVI